MTPPASLRELEALARELHAAQQRRLTLNGGPLAGTAEAARAEVDELEAAQAIVAWAEQHPPAPRRTPRQRPASAGSEALTRALQHFVPGTWDAGTPQAARKDDHEQ